jgi:type IV fimbrial biogenesis protein FimT
MNSRRPHGFTLIELMLAVAMIAILLGIAAPSVRDLTMNARITSQANDLMTDLAIARSEAVKRNVRTAICASNTGVNCTNTAWNQGWIVITDSDQDGSLTGTDVKIKEVAALDGGNSLTSTGHSTGPSGGPFVAFRPSGMSSPGGANIVFTLCDSRTVATVGAAAANNKGRRITVSGTGRAIVSRYTCP